MKCSGCFAFLTWRAPALPPEPTPKTSVAYAKDQQKPFRLTIDANSMWRPETQPWDASTPWDGRPIKICPITGRPVEPRPSPDLKPPMADKAVQAPDPNEALYPASSSFELGVPMTPQKTSKRVCSLVPQEEAARAMKEDLQTGKSSTPAKLETEDEIDLKRLCAAIASFERASEDRQRKALEAIKERIAERIKENALAARNVEQNREGDEREANRVASSTRTESRRMQEWMDRVIAKETAQPGSVGLLRRSPELKIKWKDWVWEIDTGGEDIQLEGIWMPFRPTTIVKIDVNLGGAKHPLGSLEYTTDDTVQEACHDFCKAHRLRPLFEPLLEDYVTQMVENGKSEATLDVIELL
ncbi:unnamed protein product [Durusdinium trenchii]|uniref:Uncharacterized protein n=2 Tax=Durusdinium trenchii TaxID=1381693 RepID=A0ABP0M0B3_9DINO